jgi:hypothetical protein
MCDEYSDSSSDTVDTSSEMEDTSTDTIDVDSFEEDTESGEGFDDSMDNFEDIPEEEDNEESSSEDETSDVDSFEEDTESEEDFDEITDNEEDIPEDVDSIEENIETEDSNDEETSENTDESSDETTDIESDNVSEEQSDDTATEQTDNDDSEITEDTDSEEQSENTEEDESFEEPTGDTDDTKIAEDSEEVTDSSDETTNDIEEQDSDNNESLPEPGEYPESQKIDDILNNSDVSDADKDRIRELSGRDYKDWNSQIDERNAEKSVIESEKDLSGFSDQDMIDYKRGIKSYDNIVKNEVNNSTEELNRGSLEENKSPFSIEEQSENLYSTVSEDRYREIAQSHIKNIQDKDLKPFNDYSDISYKEINDHLRKGYDISEERMNDIEIMTNNMIPLDNNYQLYRGQAMNHILGDNWSNLSNEQLHEFVGKEYEDKAFVSTSTDIEIAKKYGDSGGVIEINAPKGTNAIAMREMSAYANSEKEILLQKGLRYKIDSIEKTNDQAYLIAIQ